MRAAIFFAVLAVAMFILIGNLLRSRKIRERYAVLWFVIGLLMLVLVLFPSALRWLAGLIGVAVPSNLLFLLAIVLLLGITLQLTLEISRGEDRTRALAESIVILELQLQEMTKVTEKPGEGDSRGGQDGNDGEVTENS